MPGQSPVIVPVRQRSVEWLDAKEHGLGSSEAAAAVGMSRWESSLSLWARKLGLLPLVDETLPMRMGTQLEPLIAALYSEQTGVKVRRANMLRKHPVHDFMLASLDRRAGRKPVELKYTARGTGYGDEGTDEVPEEVLVQVLHQLAVTDEPEADVAVLIAGHREVQIYTVRREVSAESALIEREAIFWDHVESRTQPPVDGSEATRRALAAIYPLDVGDTIPADEAAAAALALLRDAQAQIDAGETAKAEAQAQLKAFMGEHYRLSAPGVGEVTWRRFERTSTAWKQVAGAYLAAIEKELAMVDSHDMSETALPSRDELAALESLYTETKPADRFAPKFEEDGH